MNQSVDQFFFTEKKMQNVLKWKNMHKYFVTYLQGYTLGQVYLLEMEKYA